MTARGAPRHTCASLAIRAGANVKVVQKQLGHKTAVLTLDKYGHLSSDGLDAVADVFDSAADDLRTTGPLRSVTGGRKDLWPLWQMQCQVQDSNLRGG
jgi:hypothetical protein